MSARLQVSPRPETQPVRRRALSVVQSGDKTAVRGNAARTLFLSTVVFLFLGLFGLVSLHVLLSQSQFRLDELEEKTAKEEARYRRLRLQVAELESPETIVKAAREELGMVEPDSVSYLVPAVETATTQDASSGAPGDEQAMQAEEWRNIKRQQAQGR